MPAVSAKTTGKPPRSRCTSITSLVVPAVSDTMAASRRANQFNKLDFPTFGGPNIAIFKPSLSLSPRCPSSKWFSISWIRVLTVGPIAASTPSGRSSSGKSIAASKWARQGKSLSRQELYKSPSTPRDCSNAWRLCASVSASIRSISPSASVKSILPASTARRVNSPGSAIRRPSKRFKISKIRWRTAVPPWRWSSTTSSPV